MKSIRFLAPVQLVAKSPGGKGDSRILSNRLCRVVKSTVIGATTQDEYRNTIMKDSALARRFNDVMRSMNRAQPTRSKILEGVRSFTNSIITFSYRKMFEGGGRLQYSIFHSALCRIKAIDLIDMTTAHLASKHPIVDRWNWKDKSRISNAQKDVAARLKILEKPPTLRGDSSTSNISLRRTETTRSLSSQPPNDVAAAVERLTGIRFQAGCIRY